MWHLLNCSSKLLLGFPRAHFAKLCVLASSKFNCCMYVQRQFFFHFFYRKRSESRMNVCVNNVQCTIHIKHTYADISIRWRTFFIFYCRRRFFLSLLLIWTKYFHEIGKWIAHLFSLSLSLSHSHIHIDTVTLTHIVRIESVARAKGAPKNVMKGIEQNWQRRQQQYQRQHQQQSNKKPNKVSIICISNIYTYICES